MERVPNGKYTREFREEAVKLVIEGGLSVPEAVVTAFHAEYLGKGI